jgi:hypothetical protein
VDWEKRADVAIERYRSGETRGLDQRQLTQLGNAAWAAGLCLLAAGRRDEANDWLRRAAERYRESWADAPEASWGRPIGAMKALLLAGDDASWAASWALDAGASESESPIGRYAGALALLVLDGDAARVAESLRGEDGFPQDVAAAVAALASCDAEAYDAAVRDVLASFESRSDFLEDVPLADTVLVLQALAAKRGIAAVLPLSPRLPSLASQQLAAIGEFGALDLDAWLFGGWAVDFHAGAATREHGDVDFAVWRDDVPRIAAHLESAGWHHAPNPDEDGGTGYERGPVRLEVTYLERDDDGIYTPVGGGRARWTDDTLGDDVREIDGVSARVVGLASLLRSKSNARDDPDDAPKDRADAAVLRGL